MMSVFEFPFPRTMYVYCGGFCRLIGLSEKSVTGNVEVIDAFDWQAVSAAASRIAVVDFLKIDDGMAEPYEKCAYGYRVSFSV